MFTLSYLPFHGSTKKQIIHNFPRTRNKNNCRKRHVSFSKQTVIALPFNLLFTPALSQIRDRQILSVTLFVKSEEVKFVRQTFRLKAHFTFKVRRNVLDFTPEDSHGFAACLFIRM